MKFVALFATLAALPAVLGLTVNTPANVVVCQPTQFSWADGTAPYFLTLIPAGQVSAPAFKQFPTQTGTSYTWLVDLQQGTSFNVALKDGTGAMQYSDIITIQPGSSTACVNLTVQETGSSGSGGSSPATSAGSGSAASPTTAAPSSSSSPAAHGNGAGRLSTSATLGVVGIMGLVGASLF